MSDLIKNVLTRMLIEVNKRMGILVDREVEICTDELIRESLKEIVYEVLVRNGESSDED